MYIGDFNKLVKEKLRRILIRLLNTLGDTRWSCESCGEKYNCPDSEAGNVCVAYRENKGSTIRDLQGICECKDCNEKWGTDVKLESGGKKVEYHVCHRCAVKIVKWIRGIKNE